MNIRDIFHQTFEDFLTFTRELEKAKSYPALREIAPMWRVIKSIQLKHVPSLDEEVETKLEHLLERLEIRDVVATSFSEDDATRILVRVGISTTIDPDLFDQAEERHQQQQRSQETTSHESVQP